MSTRMRRGNPYYQQPLFDKYGRYEIDHTAYQEKVRGMSDAALRYTIDDARKALRAMPEGHKAGYYQDEINYASDELARRRSGGRARNPYGYMIAGRTRPHAWSSTRGFPYRDRHEAKRLIGERVRAMGRRGDDVAFDAFLTEPKGRKIRKTRIRVSGYASNPRRRKEHVVRKSYSHTRGSIQGLEKKLNRLITNKLDIRAREIESRPKSRLFDYTPATRKKLNKLNLEIRNTIRKLKQKTGGYPGLLGRNPRRRNRKSVKRKLASRWAKRRPRNAKGRFVKIKKRGSRRR